MLSKLAGTCWAAPFFVAALSVITLVGSFAHSAIRPHSFSAGYIDIFFCFLPIAFYMAAAAQVAGQKQVRALQERIEQLEAQAAKT